MDNAEPRIGNKTAETQTTGSEPRLGATALRAEAEVVRAEVLKLKEDSPEYKTAMLRYMQLHKKAMAAEQYEEQAARTAAANRRLAHEDSIPGLAELKAAMSAEEEYDVAFGRMMQDENNDGSRRPKKTTGPSAAELAKKYPQAALHLQPSNHEEEKPAGPTFVDVPPPPAGSEPLAEYYKRIIAESKEVKYGGPKTPGGGGAGIPPAGGGEAPPETKMNLPKLTGPAAEIADVMAADDAINDVRPELYKKKLREKYSAIREVLGMDHPHLKPLEQLGQSLGIDVAAEHRAGNGDATAGAGAKGLPEATRDEIANHYKKIKEAERAGEPNRTFPVQSEFGRQMFPGKETFTRREMIEARKREIARLKGDPDGGGAGSPPPAGEGRGRAT